MSSPAVSELKREESSSSVDKAPYIDAEKIDSFSVAEDDSDVHVIEKAEDVAVEVIDSSDDPDLPVLTFRTVFLGIGLSAFSSVLATIYTFKPQNASVSQLFCLIIAYVLGTAMHSLLPSRGWFRYLNPGPFNIKEHAAIVMMASTASSVAVAMEVIAALDLFYDIHLNAAAALFQMFSSQMLGYGIAGMLRTLLVYPTYAFYPTYISVVNLLQSLHFGGMLNHKKRRYFWIVFAAIFCWEWIPQYPFPWLTAISIVCLIDNGRHDFVRNLFGAGNSNEGIGLLSFGTSWTLITQGNPLVWPIGTQVNSYIGMALGYIVLTGAYYTNQFNGRDLLFMSNSLFSSDGSTYNQTAILTSDNKLNKTALETVGLPRYTTTYAISQLCYNLSLGAAITHILLWHMPELKRAFGGLNFLKSTKDQDIDDPHYKEMKKYPEAPQWWYGIVFILSLAIGIGCSYSTKEPLMPWWSIILFTAISVVLAVAIGFINATTGFTLSIKYIIQVVAAFIHPGQPITVMYVNLYGNSTAFQTMYMLQDLKLGQYVKLPPKATFAAQMSGSIIGCIFNYTIMQSIVSANREVLRDPTGTRVWSGWIIQSYNSASVAMGALGKELFTAGKPYWIVPFCVIVGLFVPLPFWLAHKYSKKDGWVAKTAKFINTPIIAQYIGYLPYSVNGQWWSCFVIGMASQWWARKYRPGWFKKYNYLTSAALDGGSQVILFILSFAVFGASGDAVAFPTW
ncbi:OPT oligopeptide transporter [Punctularia strigosozonata HHB-11173 SS5]|uniref:OPT oligopeptide transporter n=1 Tax=Punctularia strigosozonata (strain HHB-11173) TaxID=741275 RepID=UPI0004416AF0|nr:OPT oligopeptide transporter [Punctularia strigosozonata HHB-11173 SS5]EIN12728.1 OPT oligopeptide transporter [Punctularia strigosozonata HHB-11173 SS5]